VFAPTQQRKIVIATNIAETSLTIPGIRFVVDTGLARISRYSPQARTRRLPIEPVAQSSADQRKGRCGRVAEGVCIRLYSEKDYLERPRFTQPEIQRANLADVILRMKVVRLGDIERFPFINAPPAKASARLSAAGGTAWRNWARSPKPGWARPAPKPTPADGEGITPIGRELARLPVDPTVGRMILQARTEKCLREVLVIAAGLSIQDPRERPLDQQAQADAAHRRFAGADSDFLTLLNIWEAFHDEFELMSQGRLRRFCHEHFLSYTRCANGGTSTTSSRGAGGARRLQDHLGPGRTLARSPDPKIQGPNSAVPNPNPQSESKIEKVQKNPWTSARRPIAPFTGASWRAARKHRDVGRAERPVQGRPRPQGESVSRFGACVKPEARKKVRLRQACGGQRTRAGKRPVRWIMAAEIVETTRLFARTAARLDPAWVLELGAHLLKVSHTEPFWSAEAGRVLVKRRARLYGLEVESRAVGYGKIDPVHATELFIREGLVNDTITWPFDFLAHNRKVRDKVEIVLTRTRSSGYLNLDEAIYRFYAARLLPAESIRAAGGQAADRGNGCPRWQLGARTHRSGSRTAHDRPEVPLFRGRGPAGSRGGGA
jgi:ATP-dependent helicase HrpA